MRNKTTEYYAGILEDAGILVRRMFRKKNDTQIRQITCNSKEVCEGSLFLCKGAAFRAKYLTEALAKGAAAYVSESEYPEGEGAEALLVTDIRKAMVVLGEAFYEHPAEQLRIVGITGTKGKTTTAYYIRSILDTWLAEQKKKESAILSSIESYDGEEYRPARLTTPETLDLQKFLRNTVNAGVSCLTMEVSSQALKYNRIGNMQMETGVFLNISRDHISPQEHVDFRDYFTSKLKMFRQCKNVCINLDADRSEEILQAAQEVEHVWTFGKVPQADVFGSNIRMKEGHLYFHIRMPGYEGDIHVPMHGVFNAENALAAAAACCAMGIPPEYIVRGLSVVKVRGRMEEFRSQDGKKTVIVDYAHNRLSFEKLFESVHLEYSGRPISVIFGCPGGKAYNRRKELAVIADRYADRIYLVPDDPGPEKPEKIAEEIRSHIRKRQDSCLYVSDRTAAIARAIEETVPGSVLLVLGKGCETSQKYADGAVTCLSDCDSVREALKCYDRKHVESA